MGIVWEYVTARIVKRRSDETVGIAELCQTVGIVKLGLGQTVGIMKLWKFGTVGIVKL